MQYSSYGLKFQNLLPEVIQTAIHDWISPKLLPREHSASLSYPNTGRIRKERESLNLKNLSRVEQLFTEPLQVKDKWVPIEASGGVSLYPEDGEELDGLIMCADMAMYEAKASGRSHITFFKGDMKTKRARSRHIKTNLQEAMGNDGFKLLYQPVVDVVGKSVVGYETLLRFKKHNIYLDEFIPVAESTGLIIPIGRWVVESAIKQIARWRSEERKCTSVSVNLSARQFHDDGIIEFIAQKLDHYDVPGDFLTIEVTETFLLEKDVWLASHQPPMTVFLRNLQHHPRFNNYL